MAANCVPFINGINSCSDSLQLDQLEHPIADGGGRDSFAGPGLDHGLYRPRPGLTLAPHAHTHAHAAPTPTHANTSRTSSNWPASAWDWDLSLDLDLNSNHSDNGNPLLHSRSRSSYLNDSGNGGGSFLIPEDGGVGIGLQQTGAFALDSAAHNSYRDARPITNSSHNNSNGNNTHLSPFPQSSGTPSAAPPPLLAPEAEQPEQPPEQTDNSALLTPGLLTPTAAGLNLGLNLDLDLDLDLDLNLSVGFDFPTLSPSHPPPDFNCFNNDTNDDGGTPNDALAFTPFGTEATPMPAPSQINHHSRGDAFHSFSGGSSARRCPFAPLRHPVHQSASSAGRHHPNPTPPPQSSIISTSTSTGAGTGTGTNAFSRTTIANTNSSATANAAFYPDASSLLLSPTSQPTLPQQPAARPVCNHQDLNNDDFLSALINGNFSSPSLPPLSSSPTRPVPPTQSRPTAHHPSHLPARPSLSLDELIDDLFDTNDNNNNNNNYGINMPQRRTPSRTAASDRPRRASRSSAASMVDLTSPKTERDSNSPLGVEPATPMAPPPPRTRKRSRTSATPTGTSSATSRRLSTSSGKPRPVKTLKSTRKAPATHDDVFETSSVADKEDDDEDILDLTGTNEVPEQLLQPKVDNRVKLSKFQCVICMDDVSGLTVTHCGHLFCSECLHSSLHIDSMKKTCPVCRTKVDIKAKPGVKQSKNTFYHLELKLMTANRKGKRPVGK
ncbi:uncharacterized protein JN550_012959 [Neoarthrinium moseri]|uniref:uncharacterized protein n=1 Tax=Neoarthrinium moseri TaxID=1658444 RepID=UPI001FDCF7D6|nr:uncharacterized protein JN550_012959 [Neoarthrinium moseri]KAI1857884.1 hypothetical protein JN550_012959 [Neoarthrinium moseri]